MGKARHQGSKRNKGPWGLHPVPTPKNRKRNQRVARLRGKLSYTLIAEQLGLTRNVVAGIFWRSDWPYRKRTTSGEGQGRHNCGTGHNGPGVYADRFLRADARAS